MPRPYESQVKRELHGAVMRKEILYRIIVTRHTPIIGVAVPYTCIFLLGLVFAVMFASCTVAPLPIFIGSRLIDTPLEPAIRVLAFFRGILEPFVTFAA